MRAGFAPPVRNFTSGSAIWAAEKVSHVIVISVPRAKCHSPNPRRRSTVPYLDTLRWVFIAVALAGIAITIYARLDDWKRGQM